MNTEEFETTLTKEDLNLSQDITDYLDDLLSKSKTVNEKTENHCNLHLNIEDYSLPVRVDDKQLIYIGAVLLPNIMNYLVNILPQFLYPYIVAYLQDLSSMREDPITINELYQFLLNHGKSIQHCTEATC